MNQGTPVWLDELLHLSQLASASTLSQLAKQIAQLGTRREALANLSGQFHQLEVRQQIKKLIEVFLTSEDQLELLKVALSTAAAIKSSQQDEVEVVWTGPANPQHMRMTHAAVLEVVQAAQSELWLVSYVFHEVKTLTQPLQQAMARGVKIRVVTEEKKRELAHQAFQNMGSELYAATEFYIWQSDERQYYSSLHAKCMLADQHKVLITSANFTAAAQYENIEMGVLISEGSEPRRINSLLHHLMQQGTLKKDEGVFI